MESIRPSKLKYYLNIAKEVAQRGTCLRRNYGAIIVKDDAIVSTGYTGAPRGTPNCFDLKKCFRQEQNIPSGKNYELCRSVHAEMNAIINAARSGNAIMGGIMFVSQSQPSEVKPKPCKLCRRMIINAGITKVFTSDGNKIILHDVEKWKKENRKDPFKELLTDGY